MECNFIVLQKLQYFVLILQYVQHMYYTKLQMLLHKTTDHTVQNYTKLHKQNYLHT